MTPRVIAVVLGALAVACGSVRQAGDATAERDDGGGAGADLDDRTDIARRKDAATPDGPPDAAVDAAVPSIDAAPVADGAPPIEAGDGASSIEAGEPPPTAETLAFGCPPDYAMLACYTFDNASNRVMDGSLHGNHGMLNSARVAAGIRGSALSFVAGNEFAIVPASPSLRVEGTGFTFEAWIRPTSSPVDARVDFIAARWNAQNVGFLFGAYAEELAINSNGGTGRRSLGKLPLERWSHVAVVVSATTVVLYIQGKGEAPQPGLTFMANDEPMTIGNRNPAQSPDVSSLTAFRGDIDVLRIYARARNPAEVCADANRTWNGAACMDTMSPP
jgi:concanavalin A-like lectin/glucanase superfamily protein